MTAFKLDFKDAKKLFFDKPAVTKAVNKAEMKVLAKQGAYLRTAARHLIKSAPYGVHAKAGNPPKSHTGLLKRFILFAFNPDNSSVIVGPTKLSKKGDAPHTLEHGGYARVPLSSPGGKTEWKGVHLKPRPFMGPALEASQPKLAEFWKNAVTA